jgi:hypothetical protein
MASGRVGVGGGTGAGSFDSYPAGAELSKFRIIYIRKITVNAVYETSTRFLGQINKKLLSRRVTPFSRLQLRFPLGKKPCVLKA